MTHEEKTARISKAIKDRRTEHVVFIKKAVSHQVPKPGTPEDDTERIDISDLDRIIEIDTERLTCTAEPGVTFSDLVKETLEHGLIPYTVPELKTITVGGAIAGGSVESMSYKYGGFHDSCLEYEVMDWAGDVRTYTADGDGSDVFHMLHSTFGTLGLITELKFKLYPAKDFVHLRYETYETPEEYASAMLRHCKVNDHDLMDGIIHSPDKLVLCLGDFSDSAPYAHSYDWMRIFHRSTAKRKEDYLRTYDYLFRYDAGCHWVGRNYGLENPVLRFIFGRFFLPSDRMLSLGRWVTRTFGAPRPDVIFDTFIPFGRFSEFFSFYLREFDYFPIWIVPYRIKKTYPWINPDHVKDTDGNLYLDLAIYGMKEKKGKNHYRIMEEELLKISGLKTLISYNYFTEDEFWKIWNRDTYSRIKKIMDPKGIFGDLYLKTHRKR